MLDLGGWGTKLTSAAAGKASATLGAASSRVSGFASSPLTDLSSLADAATVKAVNLFGIPAAPTTPDAPSGLGKLSASSANALDNAATGFKWGGALLAVFIGLALVHEGKEAIGV